MSKLRFNISMSRDGYVAGRTKGRTARSATMGCSCATGALRVLWLGAHVIGTTSGDEKAVLSLGAHAA
jgi:hypothetical protein